MGRDRRPGPPDDPTGDRALAAGVAALACSFVPVVGDVVAVPAAALAMVLGWIGIRRFEEGRASKVAAAAAGAALGAIAGLMVVVVLAATHFSPSA